MTHSMQEIRELFEKATKGEWALAEDPESHYVPEIQAGGFTTIFLDAPRSVGATELQDNAALIVALHNAFPAILARIEALEGAEQHVRNCALYAKLFRETRSEWNGNAYDAEANALMVSRCMIHTGGTWKAECRTCLAQALQAVEARVREECAALFPCMACKRGEKAVLIDEHGTLASISGLPGRLGHCQDDFFWECSASIIRSQAVKKKWCEHISEGPLNSGHRRTGYLTWVMKRVPDHIGWAVSSHWRFCPICAAPRPKATKEGG